MPLEPSVGQLQRSGMAPDRLRHRSKYRRAELLGAGSPALKLSLGDLRGGSARKQIKRSPGARRARTEINLKGEPSMLPRDYSR